MMRKVCPYGGGYCSATCEYHVVNGVSKSTCTIRVREDSGGKVILGSLGECEFVNLGNL